MTEIDSDAPILVTGATGYIAGHIVKRLLEDGRTVHAAVRDLSNESRLAALKKLAADLPGTIRFFAADLLQDGSYGPAMQDCQLVFHTASPCLLTSRNPQRDLVEPALFGTQNVLNQACHTESVRRVVLTSSCAAIFGDNVDLKRSPREAFTEEDWNTTSSLKHQPYAWSKTLAEREAWCIANSQDRWDLISINPSAVVGPGISAQATSASFDGLEKFANGAMKSGMPHYEIGYVDVRDVAEAHIRAGFTPEAGGRYLICAVNSSFAETAAVLRTHFGDAWPFPQRVLPKWIVWLFGPLVDPALTRKLVWRNVGHRFAADHSRSVRELNLSYRPVEEAIVNHFRQIVDAGRLKPAAGR